MFAFGTLETSGALCINSYWLHCLGCVYYSNRYTSKAVKKCVIYRITSASISGRGSSNIFGYIRQIYRFLNCL